MPMNTQPRPTAAPAMRVLVRGPGGVCFTRGLDRGESLIVGSGMNCSLQLDSPEVSPVHCWLRWDRGELLVQDWYSATGTLVDGKRITAETVVPPGADVDIGPFRLRFEPVETGRDGQSDAPSALCSRTAPGPAGTPPGAQATFADVRSRSGSTRAPGAADLPAHSGRAQAASFDPAEPAATGARPDGACALEHADPIELLEQLVTARRETESLRRELCALRRQSAGADDASPPRWTDSTDETMGLLREEVERLQAELADRDARLAELEASAALTGGWGESLKQTDFDTSAVVERLEQLLAELEQTDRRIADMEELVRLADEAAAAEQEERRHLEAWVSEIEQRVSERESAWLAEQETLRRRLAELEADRADWEHRAARAVSDELQAELLERYRARAGEFESQLHAAQEECRQLRRQLESAASGNAQAASADAALREERLQLARERAELARLRAELVRAQTDSLQDAASRSSADHASDARFRVLREHLKEIHERELQERHERRLSTRLARLWQRLEGRTT